LRFIITICCISLTLISWNFYSAKESSSVRKLPDSDLLYESKAFNDYIDQLQTAVVDWETVDEKLTVFKKEIIEFRYGDPAQNRLFYETFINSLRESRNRFDNASDHQFIDDLVVWFFQGPNLWNSIADGLLIVNIAQPMTAANMNQSLNDAFLLSQERAKSFRRDQKANGKSDPILQGNIPFRLFTTSQDCQVLRFPNVVGSRKVVGEFEHYLKVLQSRNQTHLYVNLLSYGRGRADEIRRRQALEKLEEDSLVNKALILVTLDKDSEFYWQKKHYATLEKADAFIKRFQGDLLDCGRNSLYKWPRQIAGPEWDAVIRHKTNDVHHRFFEGKAILSVPERQDFIELVHLFLVDDIIRKCHVNAMNITCKYTIDRGPSMLGEYYFWELARNGQDLSNEDVRKYAALLTEAPLLFHSRPAHQNRIERTQRVIERLYLIR
jgi:hypothetical protein